MVYEHGSVYLLLSKSILKINPSDFSITRFAELANAATAGIVVTDKAVYYCSGFQVYKAEFK